MWVDRHPGLVPQLLVHDRGALPVHLQRRAFGLQFFGDDDLFIFINGTLAVDLGGVHQRLPGRSTVGADGTATIVEGGAVDPTAGTILACPGDRPVHA